MGHTFDILIEITPQILAATVSTLKLAIVSFILAQVGGLAVALARASRKAPVRKGAIAYIELFRGTPLLVQLYLVYFGLSNMGISLSTFWAAAIALALNAAAYIAEIYRSGFLAMDLGQREAAQSLGMRSGQTLVYITLPQVIRVIIPPTINAAIAMLKDTSVAALISNPDLMLRALDLSSEYFTPMPIYIFAGAIYFVLSYPLSKCAIRLERHLNRAHG